MIFLLICSIVPFLIPLLFFFNGKNLILESANEVEYSLDERLRKDPSLVYRISIASFFTYVILVAPLIAINAAFTFYALSLIFEGVTYAAVLFFSITFVACGFIFDEIYDTFSKAYKKETIVQSYVLFGYGLFVLALYGGMIIFA